MSVHKHLTSVFLTLTAESTRPTGYTTEPLCALLFFMGRKSPSLKSGWMFMVTLCAHHLKDERPLFTQTDFPNSPLRKMEISLGNK